MTAAVATETHGAGPRPAIIVGVALLLGALLAGGWLLAVRSTRAEAPVPAVLTPQQQLEQVVTDQPDNIEARRRLGDLHFAENRFDQALEQYLIVLERFPQQAQTLARSGWIAFEGGDSASGHRLVRESLAVTADDPEALWYLAQIRMHGLEDPQGAVAPLRRLLQHDDVDAQLRRDVRSLLAAARRAVGDVTKQQP